MISEQVTMERVYWVMGPVPKEMRTRFPQDVTDPPTSGYGNVLVYRPKRSDAKYARVFDPATGWHREMQLESMELAGAKPVPLDVPRTVARIKRVFEERDRLGVGMSFSGANFFLEQLGAEPSARTREEEEEATAKPQKEAKPPKADPRAGLVQASDIAAKLNIEPRILRDVCRKLKIEKPAHGWCGDQKWADNIEKLVSTFLAAPKEAKPHIAKGFKEAAKEAAKPVKKGKKK